MCKILYFCKCSLLTAITLLTIFGCQDTDLYENNNSKEPPINGLSIDEAKVFLRMKYQKMQLASLAIILIIMQSNLCCLLEI